jgi:hypothetical protein
VTPGRPLRDVQLFLRDNPVWMAMPDADACIMYERRQVCDKRVAHMHRAVCAQKELVEQARLDFVELLLESVGEFVSRLLVQTNGASMTSLSRHDLMHIHSHLQEDRRYVSIFTVRVYVSLVVVQIPSAGAFARCTRCYDRALRGIRCVPTTAAL